MIRLLSLCAASISLTFTGASAQQSSLGTEDYGQWERLGSPALAPDGQTVAFTIRRNDGTSELHIRPLDAEAPLIVEEGGAPTFAGDSAWLAYRIGVSEDERERLEKADDSVPEKIGLYEVATSETSELEGIASFAFSEDGRFLAMRASPPEGDDEERGTDLVLRDLQTGKDTTFGNVSEYAWPDEISRLAMVLDTNSDVGNGVLLYDPRAGSLRTLDSGTETYHGLSWREDDDDLAVLRTREVEGFEDETHDLLAWRNLAEPAGGTLTYVQEEDDTFPSGMRIVDFRSLTWTKDGARVFFGLKEWEESPEEEAPREDADGTEGEETPETESESSEAGEPDEADDPASELAGVDVWHSQDRRINPMQKSQLERDKRKHYLAVWTLDAGSARQLTSNVDADVRLLEGGDYVIESDEDPYAREIMFGRDWADFYRIDIRSGERTQLLERVRHVLGWSSTGRYVIYLKDDQIWSLEVATENHACLTRDVPSVWVDQEYDYPVEQKPAYGVGGWVQDDESVLLYDEFDVWRAKPDGSECTRLTNGAARAVRHRRIELDDDAEFIDPADPLYYSLFGKWTKQAGFARGHMAEPVEELVLADKSVTRLAKADDADAFVFLQGGYDDSTDLFTCGLDFAEPRALSETNAFQKEYAWGHSELVEYENAQGKRLQGALYYPAGFEAGQEYPMIVYVYERLSDGLHRYVVPSERRPYNTSVFTTQDYFVLCPDIVFQPREPGVSAVDCVTAAVNAVLERGDVHAEKIGLVGHSWGGYEATYIPTRTNLFAASVAGAPLTNFLSFMGQIHWNGGMPELQHWETGQARMDVPFWDDFEAHVRNSPATFIQDLNTPLLMAFGNSDGTVDWHQGVEFYNFARRAAKFMVLLVYDGENHGLRKKPNQIDYHHRVLHWFDHFLKGVEPEPWITEGVPHLQRAEELEESGK